MDVEREDGRVEVWRVPVGGGDPQLVARDAPVARLHPDGRTLAFRTGEARSEVWAMDGFPSVPADATAAP